MENAVSVLVCVTGQRACSRLIEKGALLSKEKEADLFVLHVAKQGDTLLGASSDSDALNYLYALSQAVGAEMCVKRNDDAIKTIAEYVRQHNCRDVVLGAGPTQSTRDAFAVKLKALLPESELHIVYE